MFVNLDYEKNLVSFIKSHKGYMNKLYENLQKIGLFPNMHHIPCLAHCMHRVSEKIRTINPNIDSFISNMKLLLKALKLQKQFKLI